MSKQSRLESLSRRHSVLDEKIHDEGHRPMPDQHVLMRLKLQKLTVKEEMDRIRAVS
ncbi:MAG: YdcH family protein [Acetobacter aceti]|uniref:YdcH family protein n=1 Tax=Acetobacter aceti TaxID=435 RepID=UPI00098BC475|nr:YdcH family protein [Acetobacter aceti]